MIAQPANPGPADTTATDSAQDRLTVAEAAAELGFSKIAVYKWIQQGRVPAIRYGPRRTYITRAALDEFRGYLHAGKLPPRTDGGGRS